MAEAEDGRWQACLMGISPPSGSPRIAPIAWSPDQGGLWLDERLSDCRFLRNTARHGLFVGWMLPLYTFDAIVIDGGARPPQVVSAIPSLLPRFLCATARQSTYLASGYSVFKLQAKDSETRLSLNAIFRGGERVLFQKFFHLFFACLQTLHN